MLNLLNCDVDGIWKIHVTHICMFKIIFTNSHIIEHNIIYSNCIPNFKKLICVIYKDNRNYFLCS